MVVLGFGTSCQSYVDALCAQCSSVLNRGATKAPDSGHGKQMDFHAILMKTKSALTSMDADVNPMHILGWVQCWDSLLLWVDVPPGSTKHRRC